MDNYLLAYYQAIEDGTIVVGRWIRLFYKYIIDGLQKQSFFFDQKKGYCIHYATTATLMFRLLGVPARYVI